MPFTLTPAKYRILFLVIANVAILGGLLLYTFLNFRKIILRSLRLSSGEKLLIKRGPYLRKSSPHNRRPDMASYQFITSNRVVHLTHFFRQKYVEINESLFLENLTDVRVSMQHSFGKRKPIFYIAATKAPMLSIKTSDKSFDYYLKGVFCSKRKIGLFVECVRKANPLVNVSINFRKDDISEALDEMLYDGLANQLKHRLQIRFILLFILLTLACWRLYLYVQATGFK